MESETPPPPPTAIEARVSQLTPASIHASWADDTDEPAAYLTAHSSNSGRMHNNFVRSLSLHIQALGSRIVMRGLNDLRMYDRHKLILATHRPPTQALLTLSNHQSTVDDPAVLSNLTPYSVHTSPSAARWSWCAREMCFGTSIGGWAMRHGKIVPIVRGLGLYQTGFREAEDHLRAGHWMHVFPEGKCIPIARGIGALKWGSAKLMVDAIRRAQACRESKRSYREAMEALEHEKATGVASAHHATTAAASNTATAASSASAPVAAASEGSSVSPFARPPPIAPGASFSSALRTALLHPAFASSPSSAASAALSASAAHAAAARTSQPCPDPPLVVPLVHHGMPRVMPFYHVVPRFGKTVRVIVGDSIDVTAMVRTHDSAGNEQNRQMFQFPMEEDLLVAVTQRIAKEMRALDERLCDIEAQEGQPQVALPERPYGRGIGREHS